METNPQNGNRGGGGRSTGVAVDIDDHKPGDHHMIPVWFFVGVILFVYGLIILGAGIYEYSNPPGTVLANLHPALWWGALLSIIGGIYAYSFRPGNHSRERHQ